jgi:hypothetical protein
LMICLIQLPILIEIAIFARLAHLESSRKYD